MPLLRLLAIAALAAAGTAGLRLSLLAMSGGDVAASISVQGLGKYVLSDASRLVLTGFVAALAIEVLWTGWNRSSLRCLIAGSASWPHTDIVMMCLAVLGFQAAMASFLTAGALDGVSEALNARTRHGPLADAPAWVAAPAIYLGVSFVNYWSHRALHSRRLWPLHAVHHAAPSFTIANAARVAIPEAILIDLISAVVVAVLGGSEVAIYGAFLVSGVESRWTHSNIRGVEWLERIGINSPKGHMIHHGLDERYHNCNFGDLLCLWDKIFGTYMPAASVDGELAMGVHDPDRIYSSGNPLRDWLLPQWRWLTGLAGR